MSDRRSPPKRDHIKTGPRTALGYLDNALVDLVRQVVATGAESDPVAKKRAAIVQRVRRILRAERRAESEALLRHLRGARP